MAIQIEPWRTRGNELDALAAEVTRCPIDQVQVHYWSLDDPAFQTTAAKEVLSPEETKWLNNFRSPIDSNRRAAARIGLRYILATYIVGLPPENLQLHRSQHGKPYLANNNPPIYFNLSHCTDIAALAVTTAGEVGIDIEEIGPMAADISMHFTHDEATAISANEPSARDAAVYSCWTRKEAILKAKGGGLHHNMQDFEVNVDPNSPARLLRIDNDPHAPRTWTLHNLKPVSGLIGAVAVMAPSIALSQHWIGLEPDSTHSP